MAPSDPEVLVDQVSDPSSRRKRSLFWLSVPRDWPFSWSGYYGWFGSVLKHFRVECFKIWCLNSSNRTRRFGIIHWFNHFHFFDPQHSFRRKLWACTYLNLESYLPTSECCWVRDFVKMKIRRDTSCQTESEDSPVSLETDHLLSSRPTRSQRRGHFRRTLSQKTFHGTDSNANGKCFSIHPLTAFSWTDIYGWVQSFESHFECADNVSFNEFVVFIL